MRFFSYLLPSARCARQPFGKADFLFLLAHSCTSQVYLLSSWYRDACEVVMVDNEGVVQWPSIYNVLSRAMTEMCKPGHFVAESKYSLKPCRCVCILQYVYRWRHPTIACVVLSSGRRSGQVYVVCREVNQSIIRTQKWKCCVYCTKGVFIRGQRKWDLYVQRTEFGDIYRYLLRRFFSGSSTILNSFFHSSINVQDIIQLEVWMRYESRP